MSLVVKTLFRAICISAFAATVVWMPAEAAKKSSGHSGAVAVKQVQKVKSTKSATPAEKSRVAKQSAHSNTKDRHKEESSKSRNKKDSAKESSKDRRHSKNKPERQESRDSQPRDSRRVRSNNNQEQASERQERRYSRRSRRRSYYSYNSDTPRNNYTSDVAENIVGNSVHGYTPKATDLAMTAMSLIGTPYRYGGNSPLTGLDCSGFVRYVYKESLSTDLPRTAAEMSRVGQYVSRNELKPGDLVFYNTMRRANSHVGIYLGDDKFIHSPRTGQRVRINSMNESYWRGRFNGARRIIGGAGVDRVKALQQYSKEADTSPDTYNYSSDADDGVERPVRRSRKHSTRHVERPTPVAVDKPQDIKTVADREKDSASAHRENRHERRRARVRHPEQQEKTVVRKNDTAKDVERDARGRRGKGSRREAKEIEGPSTRHAVKEKDSRQQKDSRQRGKDKRAEKNETSRREVKADKRTARNSKAEKTVEKKNTARARPEKAAKPAKKEAPKKEAPKVSKKRR